MTLDAGIVFSSYRICLIQIGDATAAFAAEQVGYRFSLAPIYRVHMMAYGRYLR